MRPLFKYGDTVQHFKREWVEDKANSSKYLYLYLGEARFSEDKSQWFVMYKALYDDPKNNIKMFDNFIRPLEMFYSEVDREKYPDASQHYRFEKFDNSKFKVHPIEQQTICMTEMRLKESSDE